MDVIPVWQVALVEAESDHPKLALVAALLDHLSAPLRTRSPAVRPRVTRSSAAVAGAAVDAIDWVVETGAVEDEYDVSRATLRLELRQMTFPELTEFGELQRPVTGCCPFFQLGFCWQGRRPAASST
jgi:hypothetical protein